MVLLEPWAEGVGGSPGQTGEDSCPTGVPRGLTDSDVLDLSASILATVQTQEETILLCRA